VFGNYALLISMLAYTAWHAGKPLLELWGTLPWGLLAGVIALATRTIWPIIIVHWLLNVFLDVVIYKGL
jgi:membrane protease YdiL (CAAX protease family)